MAAVIERRVDAMEQTALVIAAYNEARTIAAVVTRAMRWCAQIYVIDDGSTDGTAEALAGLDVRLLRHPRNEGKGASLWDGMQAALADGAEAVITLDGDGQHDPDDIPRLLAQWRRTPGQLVIGARLAQRAAFPKARYFANRFANFWISWAAGYRISDSQSGFRLYPARALRQLPPRPRRADGFVFESRMLIHAAAFGIRSASVPIAAVYRDDARPSHFRAVRDVAHITRMVADRLLRRGLHPRGLWNVVGAPHLQRLRALGRGGATTLALSFAVMGLSLGLSWLAVMVRALYLAVRAKPDAGDADALLVPGLALRDGTVGEDYALRLERARRLWQRRRAPRLLLLGGRADISDGISEAAAGRAYLLQRGMPAAPIRLEDRSRNTLENLRQARTLLANSERTIVISNRYHLARCHALASALGIDHALCAAEARWRWQPATLWALVKESVHLHWYYTGRCWARLIADPELLSRTR